MGLHSWSYEIPVEKRRVAPQLFPPIPPPPPLGLSGFTARKQCKFIRIESIADKKNSCRSSTETCVSRSS